MGPKRMRDDTVRREKAVWLSTENYNCVAGNREAHNCTVDWYNCMTPDQQERYGFFKNSIESIVGGRCKIASGEKQFGEIMLITGGVTKMFLSEVIEKARIIADRKGDIGPLLPMHLREAHDEISRDSPLTQTVPYSVGSKRRRWCTST